MPWARYRIPFAFMVSFMLIIYALSEAWQAGKATRRQGEWTVHTAIVLNKTEQVLRSSIDAEVGMRRYFVTRQNLAYLALYNNSRVELAKQIAQLEEFTQDNALQQARIAVLKTRIETKISELDQMLVVSRTQGREAAMKLIEMDEGKLTMDALRRDISEIQETEKTQLRDRNEKFAQAYDLQTRYVVLAIIGAFIVAGATVLVMNRQMEALRSSRAELASLNVTLEQKVDERTLELMNTAVELEQRGAETEFERSRVELLLRELNHRVGNNLAMVSSFLGLEAANTQNGEARAIIDRARTRIQGIATAQRRLRLEDDLESANAQITLTDVIEDLINTSTHQSDVALDINIGAMSLPARDITTLAIITSELVTNALKYAFVEPTGGILAISLAVQGKGLVLTVRDNGVGVDADALKARVPGLGRNIIERLARQYGGTVAWVSAPGAGTLVSVTLPTMQVRAAGDMEPSAA